MPKRRVVVLQDDEAWKNYLLEAFEDTASTPEILKTAQEALPIIRQSNPEVVFINAHLLTAPLTAALQMNRSSNTGFRAFRLGPTSPSASTFHFESSFDGIPPTLYDFQKQLTQNLPLPDPIRLLVVDDEPEIGELFRDYFERRTGPAFTVETARDGIEAEKQIEKSMPDVLVLDIKMPKRDGRELYRELKNKGKLPPTIVFVDLTSADEVLEIRQWGSPAFVEKGSSSSSMPQLAALIKKLSYFG